MAVSVKPFIIACPACEQDVEVPVILGPLEREGDTSSVSVDFDHEAIAEHVRRCPALHDEGPGMTIDELLGQIDDVLETQKEASPPEAV